MLVSYGLLALAALPFSSALPAITSKGKYLFDPSGNRFFIKGVAYQEPGAVGANDAANQANGGFPEPSSFIDPLAQPSACTRDLPLLKDLGVNAVRIYSVDNTQNHDACMKMLSDAGIYTIIDLSLPLNGSINRAAPAWTTNLLDLYIETIDAFSKYDNVLAYNVGNEVINLPNNTNVAPFVKAAARDTKAYLKSKSSSALVGYSTSDGSAFRDLLVQFMTCDSEPVSVDIVGLNTYRWCGDSTLDDSGYDKLVTAFQPVPVPTYLSEFGCTKSLPRLWTEVKALFSPPMSDVWSGGAAFSYFDAQIPDFGLVTISGANNETATPNNDYALLKGQFQAAVGPASTSAAVTDARTYPACPAQSDAFLGSSKLPATPNDASCQCLSSNAFPCVTSAAAANSPNVLGALLDYGCSLLGSSNAGSCAAIGDDGAAGTYGALSSCDPATKLSYVFSQYYQSQGNNPQSCDFAGNATVNAKAPTSSSAVAQAQSSCLALAAGATFVPTAPSGRPASSGSGSSGSSGSGKPNSAFGSYGAVSQMTVVGVLLASVLAGVQMVLGA